MLHDRLGFTARTSCLALVLGIPVPACAHFFVQSYALPIPFWMYAWGAAGALLLSFLAIGVFASVPRFRNGSSDISIVEDRVQCDEQMTPSRGGLVALGLLLLCILTGLAGRANPFTNFNMTFFWIVFVLGVPYLIALVGDFYSSMNPWETLVRCMEKLSGSCFTGRLTDPDRYGHWPAVLLYLGFICLELFGRLTPFTLSQWLIAYSLLNVAGAWLLGRQRWFLRGEFFGVMFRLLGALAPIGRESGKPRVRRPLIGLLRMRVSDLGLVVFVLFMLSSTAFDGLHGTKPWVNFFWYEINPVLAEHIALAPRQQNALSAQLYVAWQYLTLAASPFVYLALFVGVLATARVLVGDRRPVREIALLFATSLIPIAFVYHVTHYFTLLLAQGPQLVRLISDPLGLGWNIFGTFNLSVAPVMIEMGTLWHLQVGLILAGHILSVWVAHARALSELGSPWRATLSQLPMLALMMLFTAFGLWILSLPLASGG